MTRAMYTSPLLVQGLLGALSRLFTHLLFSLQEI